MMNKPLEYCPSCGSRRELDQSLGMMAIDQPGEEILIYQYHCASCNSYVHSTTLDYQEIVSPYEVAVISIPTYA
jgi:rRNA maturation endonuclease Nob1